MSHEQAQSTTFTSPHLSQKERDLSSREVDVKRYAVINGRAVTTDYPHLNEADLRLLRELERELRMPPIPERYAGKWPETALDGL